MIPTKPDIAARARVKSLAEYEHFYRWSLEDPAGFWREQARIVDWFAEPAQITAGDFRDVEYSWFSGGKLNVAWNCVDRHAIATPDKVAIVWAGDEPGDYRSITYRELQCEVGRMANVLLAHGVRRGDRVCIYLPMIA